MIITFEIADLKKDDKPTVSLLLRLFDSIWHVTDKMIKLAEPDTPSTYYVSVFLTKTKITSENINSHRFRIDDLTFR